MSYVNDGSIYQEATNEIDAVRAAFQAMFDNSNLQQQSPSLKESAPSIVIPEGQILTSEQKKRLYLTHSGPWHRPPNTSIAPPSADSFVARSLINAKPSPFRPPLGLSQMDWDEESVKHHWLIDDTTLFYNTQGLPRSSNRKPSEIVDLNISLPIIVPHGKIRVINAEGENYYYIDPENTDDYGTHILFGGNPDLPAQGGDASALAASGSSGGSPPQAQPLYQSDSSDFPVIQLSATSGVLLPSLCDVWASFLSVHLGTVKNCRMDQVPEIAHLFSKAMTDRDLGGPVSFDAPIRLDCRGIHIPRGKSAHYDKSRLETHAYLASESDIAFFRILRRRVKYFMLLVLERFSVDLPGPKFGVELTHNCKTGEQPYFRIEIRRYGTAKNAEEEEFIRAVVAASIEDPNRPTLTWKDLPPIALGSSVLSQEIRLEMTHARTVDPRWINQWILARRMPVKPQGSARLPSMAHHILCNRMDIIPRVVYQMDKPRQTLLGSRFGALYLLHANTVGKDKAQVCEQQQSKLSASAAAFFPLTTMLSSVVTPSATFPTLGAESKAEEPNPIWEKLIASANSARPPPQPHRPTQAGPLANLLKNGGATGCLQKYDVSLPFTTGRQQ